MLQALYILALVASALSRLLPPAQELRTASQCGPQLCINATVRDALVTYEMTLLDEPLGWLALGFGSRMKGTHMVIMWRDDDGTTTLSQRRATGYREPRPVKEPPRRAVVAEPQISMEGNPKSLKTLAFSIPTNQTILSSQDPTEHIIWAYSKNRPEKSPQAGISFHYRAGLMELKFGGNFLGKPPNETSPHTESPSTLDTQEPKPNVPPFSTETSYRARKYEYIMIAHGVLVALGFLVLLPAGSLIARWSRSFTPKWFKAHQMVNMSFAFPLLTLGWILGPTAVYHRRAMHLSDPHHIGGVLLVILYYLQVTLGRYIHKRRANAAPGIKFPSHPPLNILHVALGLAIIVGAFAQTRSGFEEWNRATGSRIAGSYYVLWKMWAVVTLLAYLAGTIFLRRQFYQERKARDSSSGDHRTLPLADVHVVLNTMEGGSPRKHGTNKIFQSIDMGTDLEVPLLRPQI